MAICSGLNAESGYFTVDGVIYHHFNTDYNQLKSASLLTLLLTFYLMLLEKCC